MENQQSNKPWGFFIVIDIDQSFALGAYGSLLMRALHELESQAVAEEAQIEQSSVAVLSDGILYFKDREACDQVIDKIEPQLKTLFKPLTFRLTVKAA